MGDPVNDDHVSDLLAAAYAVDGPDGNRDLYRRWADTYDTDFIQASGYVYHERVVDLLLGAAPVGADDAVLDVGCGTGVVGEALRARGVAIVDGVDISPEMLDRAAAKTADDESPVYRDLIEADLTDVIDVETGRYQALISTGAFTHGHLGPAALDELVRVCAQGARCAIGINASHFTEHGFDRAIERLITDGLVADAVIESAPIYARSNEHEPDSIARVALLTVA